MERFGTKVRDIEFHTRVKNIRIINFTQIKELIVIFLIALQ